MAKNLILGPRDVPATKAKWFVFSLQQVFAMFGSTVLVPILVGFDTSLALFTAGIGTLIYIAATKAKVPVFLGSSFAFLPFAFSVGPHGFAMGVMIWGAIYLLIAGIVKFTGTAWIKKALPPIVIGPTIIVIGLSLAPVAVGMIGLQEGTDNFMNTKSLIIAGSTFLAAIAALTLGKGMIKIIPVIIAIVVGYLVSIATGYTDLGALGESIKAANFIGLPDFSFVFDQTADFSTTLIVVIPLALVTLAEHIGDHNVISEVCGEDFLQEPGLHRTLLGDGAATMVSGFFGGPVNTTYGENTSTVQLSRIGSVYVTGLAAIIALLLSFFPAMAVILASIPMEVMGGVSLVLFGLIAFNGVKVLTSAGDEILKDTNMIIIATMLVIGLGGALITFTVGTAVFGFSGVALTVIIGLVLNGLLNHLVPAIKGEANKVN